jgi:hypothetical protein
VIRIQCNRTVLLKCLILSALLLTQPLRAKSAEYQFQVVRIGPGNSHITIRLLKKASGKPVPNALINVGAAMGPKAEGVPTMVVPGMAVPDQRPGEYTLMMESGMEIFDLDLEAAVPGETELVVGKLHLKDAK